MLRRVAYSAVFLVAGVLGAGCFGAGEVALPTGAECGSQTFEGSGEGPLCEGGVCLILVQNAQSIDGMCSQECWTDDDCTPHEGCETTVDGAGTFCLRLCETDDDCYDRFVCRLLAIGNPHRYCLIDPI